jgi:hypothetical protein
MMQMHYFRRFCENSLYLLGDAFIHRGSEKGSSRKPSLTCLLPKCRIWS